MDKPEQIPSSVWGKVPDKAREVQLGKWKNRGKSKFNRVAEVMSILFSEERHVVGLAIVHTDIELLEMVNECLNEDERISIDTYKRYCNGDAGGKWEDEEIARVFRSAYQRVQRMQRERLFQLMAEDQPGGWQRWTWILERKFDDWNLRNKVVDETPDVKRLVFRVHDEKDQD